MNDHRISELPLFLGRVSHKAVVNPADWIRLGTELGWISKNIKIPKLCLIAFFREAYEWIKQEYKPKIFNLFSFPIYVFNHHEADIALTQAGIGAPAAALKLEEVFEPGLAISPANSPLFLLTPFFLVLLGFLLLFT